MSKNKKLLFSLLSVDIPIKFCPIIVGKICSVYGILGWLKVLSYTDKFDNIMRYQPWFIQLFSKWLKVIVESWRNYKRDFFFIVKVKNISDRDLGLLLSNCKIFIDVSQFPLLRNEEYYWKDIIGSLVVGVSGYQFGRVIDLIETGSNDVLVVGDKKYSLTRQNYLIPFIMNRVIKNVDITSSIIYVDWDILFR